MSSPVDSIATPLVRGVLGALSSLGIALAAVTVPALAAQVAGTASSATVLDAVLIALSVLVLGHGGGIMLSTGVIDGPVTLTPFGLLVLLLLLSALSMRRVGRALRLVRDDGVLRVRAMRDAGSALGMYAVVYAIGLAVLAGIGRSVDTSPVVTSAVVSGLMVAVLGGLAGLLWSLRRDPTDAVPGVRVLELLPAPYGDVARAAVLALTGMFALGMALVVVLLLVSVPAQSALFDQLAPGIVGGVVLTLIQLALLPLVAVWALAVLLGGTIGVGTSTGISLDGAETGVLPALPMLGALPGPGDFPTAIWLLMLLPAVPVVLGAMRLVRDVEPLGTRERVTAWVAYPVVVVVAVLVLAGLSTGGIGEGRLVHLGPQMSTLVLPLIGVVVLGTALVLAVRGTGLVPFVRGRLGSLRSRVEAAERREQGEEAHPGEQSGHDAATERSALMERFRRRNAPALPGSPADAVSATSGSSASVPSGSSASGPSTGSASADATDEVHERASSAASPTDPAGTGRAEGGDHEDDDLEADAWAMSSSPQSEVETEDANEAEVAHVADAHWGDAPEDSDDADAAEDSDDANDADEADAAADANDADEADAAADAGEADAAEDAGQAVDVDEDGPAPAEDAPVSASTRRTWLSRRKDR